MKPITDPLFVEACASPQISRVLLQYAAERGHDPQQLCRGLGFEPDDLKSPAYRLSHRQSYMLVRRALGRLGDTGLGLAIGSRQTAVSWGLVGLAMQASPTLGAAFELAVRYQRHAGALLIYEMRTSGDLCLSQVVPRFYDIDVMSFYLEEAFASTVAVACHLSGLDLVPRRIELEYPQPPHWRRYEALFRCPVIFGAPHNLIEFDTQWLDLPLATRDDYVAAEITERLESARGEDKGPSDLVETIQREVRNNLKDPPSLIALAQLFNLGERTLRRRLVAVGLSYFGIVDSLRRIKALSLLNSHDKTLAEVASETGFNDVRDFRRAFKRWTGVSPREARHEIQKIQPHLSKKP
jgi:AraC-like DNA-binding protein